MIVYLRNFMKLLMKYLKQTYRGCTKEIQEANLYNEISQRGEMLRSMRQAVISCFYNWDRENITNWCPVSLPNYDNKRYTKILANKIQPTLEDVIVPKKTEATKESTIIESL